MLIASAHGGISSRLIAVLHLPPALSGSGGNTGPVHRVSLVSRNQDTRSCARCQESVQTFASLKSTVVGRSRLYAATPICPAFNV